MNNVEFAIKEACKKMSSKYGKNSYDPDDYVIGTYQEHEKYIETKNKLKQNGNLVMYSDDLPKASKSKGLEAVKMLLKNVNERPSLSEELSVYRKYVPILLEYQKFYDELNQKLMKTLKRYETDSEERKFKRWTDEEDELLIEMVCSEKFSMLEISTTIGRTVPAIKSRISKLVGIRRLSQEIAGRFIGTINGNHAECVIDGTIYKKEGA